MEKIIRLLKYPWTQTSFKWGSRRMNKWIKKNNKDIIEERHPFQERYEYTFKKFSKLSKRTGIDLEISGKEYLPKGNFLIIPKSNTKIDNIILVHSLGLERNAVPVMDESFEKGKASGYWKALNAFYLKQDEIDLSEQKLNAALSWGKSKNKAIIVNPYNSNNNISQTLFKVAKRLYIPIVLVTIENAEKVSVLGDKQKVLVKFHDVIKPIRLMNLTEDKISELVRKEFDK